MDPLVLKVLSLIVIAVAIAALTCWKAATSKAILKEQKIAIYIVAILAPVIGLLILILLEYQARIKK